MVEIFSGIRAREFNRTRTQTLKCPLCKGRVLRRIDTQGNTDLYRCLTPVNKSWLTPDGQLHQKQDICGQQFRKRFVGSVIADHPSEYKKRPELVVGRENLKSTPNLSARIIDKESARVRRVQGGTQ